MYGVGVGELATKVDANGQTVLDRSNLLATYTADEIAFWQNAEKVAYINNGALYMPAANITGGTLNINNKFTVDLLGNMKARCTLPCLLCLHSLLSYFLIGTDIPDNLDISPTKLGAWKHESTFTRARFLKQKTYAEESDGKLTVTCAGMPYACHEHVTWENFHIGSVYDGKLKQKRVRGGVILEKGEQNVVEHKKGRKAKYNLHVGLAPRKRFAVRAEKRRHGTA